MIDSKMMNAQLILAKAKSDADSEDVIRQLSIEFIRVYSLIETNTVFNESIICIYADYYDTIDNTDYTASIYFRKSSVTTHKTLTYYADSEHTKAHKTDIELEKLHIDFMCMLDEH